MSAIISSRSFQACSWYIIWKGIRCLTVAVSDYETVVLESETAVSESERAVSDSETAVSQSERAVSQSETVVSDSETTVSGVTFSMGSQFPRCLVAWLAKDAFKTELQPGALSSPDKTKEVGGIVV